MSETVTIEYFNGDKNYFIMGVEFNLDPQKESSFNAVVYDSEFVTIEHYGFVWSIDQNIFVQKTHGNIANKRRSLCRLRHI